MSICRAAQDAATEKIQEGLKDVTWRQLSECNDVVENIRIGQPNEMFLRPYFDELTCLESNLVHSHQNLTVLYLFMWSKRHTVRGHQLKQQCFFNRLGSIFGG